MVCVCFVMSDSVWPMDHSPPGSSVHGILQAGTLEWVGVLLTQVLPSPAWAGVFFTASVTQESLR